MTNILDVILRFIAGVALISGLAVLGAYNGLFDNYTSVTILRSSYYRSLNLGWWYRPARPVVVREVVYIR